MSRTLTIGDGEITIELPHDPLKVSREAIVAYVKSSAEAVSTYIGRFPVARLTVRVSGRKGADVGGTEYDGKLIVLEIGADMEQAALRQDWVATHEMLHLAFPSVGEKYAWMNEGLSDYLEPVAGRRWDDIGRGGLARVCRGNASSAAGSGGSGFGQYPYVGEDVLGRMSLLALGRRANSRTNESEEDVGGRRARCLPQAAMVGRRGILIAQLSSAISPPGLPC